MNKIRGLFSLLLSSLLMTGCLPSDIPSSNNQYASVSGGANFGPGAAGATETETGASSSTPTLPKIEIRHLIEPNLTTDLTYSSGTGYSGKGNYVRKLSLPKNYAGRLYLAGINFESLRSNLVKVRFKFGLNRDPIIVPAFVASAPGIIPSSSVSVLVMDMRPEYFRTVRLPYDLFDYNEYDFSTTSNTLPEQNNLNSNLFCRGLRLEDDPTFEGILECDGSPTPEKCLYSYAKVLDQGLIQASGSNFIPSLPSFPQIRISGSGSYYSDAKVNQLRKPLPDSPLQTHFSMAPSLGETQTDAVNFDLGFNNVFSFNGSNYYFAGPYRLINYNSWHIKGDANYNNLLGSNGLFRSSVPYTASNPLPDTFITRPGNRIFYQSLMFPLAGKLDLQSNVSHLSSSNWNDQRSTDSLTSSGETQWVDGANIRAQSRNSELEHIGSCNVTSSIEIIATDNNGVEFVIAVSKDVKLQLVRSTQYITSTGDDVLYSNFKTCDSSSSNPNAACGANGCCFNNRCWDQSLVSQCYSASLSQSNLLIGENCSTDLQCTSLCCNRTTGKCAPHNTLLSPKVTCSKPIGDFCIAKEWCQKVPITKCLIVKTGTDAQGNVTCRQQCYTNAEHGNCKQGICVAPEQEVPPTFDPNDPNSCDNAVNPPNF